MNDKKKKEVLKRFRSYSFTTVLVTTLICFITVFGFFAVKSAVAGDSSSAEVKTEKSEISGETEKGPSVPNAHWYVIAAAIAVGVGSIAGGLAVSSVGSAAMAAISEKPEVMGQALLFVGLAEGIAIYGLIVAIFILMKI